MIEGYESWKAICERVKATQTIPGDLTEEDQDYLIQTLAVEEGMGILHARFGLDLSREREHAISWLKEYVETRKPVLKKTLRVEETT